MTSSLLDEPIISGRYLFPQPRTIDEPFVVDVEGARIACYLQMDDPARCTLVHFHGNGEAAADYRRDFAPAVSQLGLNLLLIEYREYGGSTGRAQLVAMLGDGAEAISSAGIPFERVIAMGRSIGSLYAIELAYRHPEIAGLVIESGIADPTERFLAYADLEAAGVDVDQVARETALHFNHQEKLGRVTCPTLLMHTRHDGLIDFSHAQRNFDWCGSSRKQLVEFPAGDHNSIMAVNWPAYLEQLEQLVSQIPAV